MPRVSFNEMTTYHWSFDDDVVSYQAAGIAGIGVWRRKLTEFGEERGIELLRESRLSVSSLFCAGGFTGSDGHSFREAIDDAHEALQLAADIQAGCLVVVTGARAGHTAKHARRIVRDALVELGDAGAKRGVHIAVQPMRCQPEERWTFLTSLDATLELLELCDHPQVGMVFDVFHLWGEASLGKRIREIGPRIKIAALCDVRRSAATDDDRCLPGEGIVPLGEIVRTLEESGYRGWYDVQLLGEPSWKSDYDRLIAGCRSGLQAACPELFGESEATIPPHSVLSAAADGTGTVRVAVEPAPPQ